jgi:hypothetical protein
MKNQHLPASHTRQPSPTSNTKHTIQQKRKATYRNAPINPSLIISLSSAFKSQYLKLNAVLPRILVITVNVIYPPSNTPFSSCTSRLNATRWGAQGVFASRKMESALSSAAVVSDGPASGGVLSGLDVLGILGFWC